MNDLDFLGILIIFAAMFLFFIGQYDVMILKMLIENAADITKETGLPFNSVYRYLLYKKEPTITTLFKAFIIAFYCVISFITFTVLPFKPLSLNEFKPTKFHYFLCSAFIIANSILFNWIIDFAIEPLYLMNIILIQFLFATLIVLKNKFGGKSWN